MAKLTGRSKTATIRISPENLVAAEIVAALTGRTVSSLAEYSLKLFILKNYPDAYKAGAYLQICLSEAPEVRE